MNFSLYQILIKNSLLSFSTKKIINKKKYSIIIYKYLE
jgi:hypothetical protein